MIKLLDIVKEVELQGNKVLDNKMAIHDDLHYNDHMKEIEKHIQKSLATNDPKFIHKQLEEIIKHATSAQDKVLATKEWPFPTSTPPATPESVPVTEPAPVAEQKPRKPRAKKEVSAIPVPKPTTKPRAKK